MTLHNLEKHRDAIELCGKCGDCSTDGTEISTAKKNIDRPCAVKNVLGFEAYDARGRILVMKNLLNGRLDVTPSLLEWAYSCTTCGSCKETCLAIDGGIDTPSIMEAMRRDLVANNITLDKHGEIARSISENGNPYVEASTKRRDILAGRKVTPGADVLLFIGCTSTFREAQIANATMDILEKLGIEYNVLEDEGCCGSVLKRLGYEERFRVNALENIEMVCKSGAKNMIFPCAGCYRTFKQDYKQFETSSIQYMHVSEFLDEWLSKHPTTFKLKHHARITYHDPCHTGRHLNKFIIRHFMLFLQIQFFRRITPLPKTFDLRKNSFHSNQILMSTATF